MGIGIIVIIVGDLAGIFGCLIGLKDEVTAITFVALGTSLPDTFASKAAAVNEQTADNAIGNVTGSNSVNVFLGLGLPWTIGALVWGSKGGKTQEWQAHVHRGQSYEEGWGSRYPMGGFLVPAGSLGFSVAVFTSTACAGLLLLMFRR